MKAQWPCEGDPAPPEIHSTFVFETPLAWGALGLFLNLLFGIGDVDLLQVPVTFVSFT
eukprot:CAMPEP_0179141510 /NCGR_PEP_ID=MMETSP0796-20121207/67875_1 /TAXON_ID=73915 /ORGANISM="Pyrodinium bahamense, Strain pbaha01" /LENGTH=57 /DNA_ID=CAMNT_0020841239 /DNA_START=37 /DNA_END=208 /DNA_ORIENTATION=+